MSALPIFFSLLRALSVAMQFVDASRRAKLACQLVQLRCTRMTRLVALLAASTHCMAVDSGVKESAQQLFTLVKPHGIYYSAFYSSIKKFTYSWSFEAFSFVFIHFNYNQYRFLKCILVCQKIGFFLGALVIWEQYFCTNVVFNVLSSRRILFNVHNALSTPLTA